MKKIIFFLSVVMLTACSNKKDQLQGKWFSKAENGEYTEMWFGEDKAIAYLSGPDEFFLYEMDRLGASFKFSLRDSRIVEEHEFMFIVMERDAEHFSCFSPNSVGEDSVKHFYIIEKEMPEIGNVLASNREHMKEMFARLDEDHRSHGH